MSKNKKWTLEDMPDLSGKVVIVTGANSGLGFECVKAFAHKEAKTIMACRNLEKARKALDKILKKFPNVDIEIMLLDLASLESIRKFVSEFKGKYDRLDILVNNAGIMFIPYEQTVDGFERQIGTNHLGHFALTAQLFDLIVKTDKARVVNVSSTGHRLFGTMDFDNFLFENGDYSPTKSYGRSKLANLLFTYEMDRRLKGANINAIAVAAHPGAARTNLAKHLRIYRVLSIFLYPMTQSAAKGALPSIRAAVDPEVKAGQYYGPKGRREMKGPPVKVESSEASHNMEDAKKLWELSEKLTGIEFKI